jgi:hypothetical protein
MILISTLAVAKVNEENIVVFEDCGSQREILEEKCLRADA